MTLNNATGCKDYRMLGDMPTLAVYNLKDSVAAKYCIF